MVRSNPFPFSLTPSNAPLAIGPSGWHYPHWDGVIYPRRRPRGFHPLQQLSAEFDAVEISASFENDIKPELARLWMAKVEANSRFQFTARMHRRFTHERDLSPAAIESFSVGLRELKKANRLGAVLLQFPWSYRFTKENRDHFVALRRAFHEFPLVAEMRHESWMATEAVGTLIDYRVGFCNLDQPEHIKAMPPTAFLTSSVAYFRLHGRQRTWWWNEYRQSTRTQAELNAAARNKGYAYSPTEMIQWKERVEQVRDIAERTFCFFTNDGGGQSVLNAMQFQSMCDAPMRRAPGVQQHQDLGLLELAVA